MEPNSGTLTQISQGITHTVHPVDYQMDYTPALLALSLLQVFSMATASPLPRDVLFMKTKVKMNAEQLMRKLDSSLKLLIPGGRTISPHPDNVEGLSSIVRVLEGYENLLSESLDGVPQLKQEVSSLRGYLDAWKQVHCRDQRPKPAIQGRLAQLLTRKEYVHTVGLEALMGLKDFLNQLLKNLDQLGTC